METSPRLSPSLSSNRSPATGASAYPLDAHRLRVVLRSAARHTPNPYADGSGAARLAAVLLLTAPGVPIIYYGDEAGMDVGEIYPQDLIPH